MSRFILIFATVICSLLDQSGVLAENPKLPKVWIYTDMSDPTLQGTNHRGTINDPDDVSAMAGYLLLADRFETLGIVVASTHRKEHATTPDQAAWANRVFGEAYRADVVGLKQSSKSYPDNIQFVQSCIKESAEKFVDGNRYDSLAQYSTIKSLFDTASQLGDDEIINVLCWGSLTEPAILVAHCLATNNASLLKKLRFIAHWTNSPLHQGTTDHPERVANCQEDAAACRYLKSMAGAGKIVYYECGAIGQHGIVSGSPKGQEYFDQFRTSQLGTLFVEGKYVNNCVDHSDSASYWVLLEEYGVSLKDIAADGTNSAELERANEANFAGGSKSIHDELLRRSKNAVNKISHTPVPAVPNDAGNNPLTLNGQPFYGADPSVVVADDDRLFLFPTTDNRDWEKQFGWSCYSTTDLVHWNDHGVIFSNEDSSWGTHKAWAPDIIKRGGKYYLYYYFNNGGGGKGGVGVAVADKPEGPYKEITKERLCAGHDPAVFGDDDGRFWLYLQDKVYELGDDMASFKSGPTNLNLEYRPEKFEAAYVFKRNGLYYFTIARDWNNLVYYTGSSPTGHFEFRGEFFKKYGGNNHHSIVKYKDKWVIFYHEWVKNDPVHQRRLRAEYLSFNEDGTIQFVEPTDQGVRFDQVAEPAVDDVSKSSDISGLLYSGIVHWDANSGIVTFATSGSMPDSLEDFFWDVPASVKTIIIEPGVTVRGAFRVRFRDTKYPLFITGRDRKTSVIEGTEQQKWTEKAGITDSNKWRYGAINVIEDATVHVSKLTSRNPRGYNISGYANNAVIHVDGCDLLDTRGGDNNNSDGFLGAAGSSIRNSFISTSDDAIKVYNDITIENVTIEQHRNGAPLQFGWSGENDTATATIKNLTIRGVASDSNYNMAPLTWVAGERGVRNITIDGLTIDLQGKIYNETNDTWQPIGLMSIKPDQCTLNLTVNGAKTGGLPLGVNAAKGSVRIEPSIDSPGLK
jgi:hypothetical protein